MVLRKSVTHINYTRVINQEELDGWLGKLKDNQTLYCFVQLNFGLRSSKDISFTKDEDYFVFNEIDVTEVILSIII